MLFFFIFLCLKVSPGGVDMRKNTIFEVSGLNFSKSEKSTFGDFEPTSDWPSGGPNPSIAIILKSYVLTTTKLTLNFYTKFRKIRARVTITTLRPQFQTLRRTTPRRPAHDRRHGHRR